MGTLLRLVQAVILPEDVKMLTQNFVVFLLSFVSGNALFEGMKQD